MDDNNLYKYLVQIPKFMADEITRFKNINDAKLKLASRLMVKHELIKAGHGDLLTFWKVSKNGKPFIKEWMPFNISHSGNWVVLSYSEHMNGVDIEKENPLNCSEILKFFHPKEKEAVLQSNDIIKSFYNIWVKKEAFLKTVGLGIVNNLSSYNCLEESIFYNGKSFYFYDFPFEDGYAKALCSDLKNENVVVKKMQ